jgi:hypothetical protein
MRFREEQRFRVYEKELLKHLEAEVMGGQIKLHNKELHNSHCSPNISGVVVW